MRRVGRHVFVMANALWRHLVVRLLLGTLLVWTWLGGLRMRLDQPLALWQDHTVFLMQSRLFLERGWHFDTVSLGWPAGLALTDFPFTDLSQRLLLFATTWLAGAPVAGVNLYLFGIATANLVAGTLALQAWLRNPGLALAGGVIFALLPLFARAGGHDALAGYYPAAIAFLLARRAALAGDGRAGRMWRWPGTWLGVAIVAASGFYYSFFAVLLWSFLAAALTLQDRAWGRLPPFAALAGVSLVLLAALLGWQILAASGANGFPARHFIEQPLYAARLADLVVVLEPLHLLPHLVPRYLGARPQTEGLDFWPGPVLSLVALLACLFAPVLASRPGIGSHPRLRPALLAWLVFCLLFATPYGLGMAFNLLVAPEVRAQGRLGPFFGFAVLVLAGWWTSQGAARLRAWRGRHQAAALLAVGLALVVVANGRDQWQLLARRQQAAAPAALVEAESVGQAVTAARAAGLRTVLQLPVLPWPEAPPRPGFDPYSATLPYILDPQVPTLRWSAGLTWNRTELAPLQEAERRPTCLVPIAKALGFDAVLLDHRAYTAEAAAALESTLRHAGVRPIADAGPRRLYALPTTAAPCPPPALARGQWLALEHAAVALDSSWYPEEAQLRWGRGAVQRLTLPTGEAKLGLRLMVLPDPGGAAPTIAITADGQPLTLLRPARPMQAEDFELTLPAGLVGAAGMLRLELRQSGGPQPAARANAVDIRWFGPALLALRLDPAR